MFGKSKDNKSGSKKYNLPSDYEECGTCGYDHAYDILTEHTRNKMLAAHQAAGDEVPNWSKRGAWGSGPHLNPPNHKRVEG